MRRHIRRSQRTFVQRAEANPRIHEYRRVKAEAERTGDDSLYVDFGAATNGLSASDGLLLETK